MASFCSTGPETRSSVGQRRASFYIAYGIEFGRMVTAAARHTIRAQDSSMGANVEHCDPDAAGRVRHVRLF